MDARNESGHDVVRESGATVGTATGGGAAPKSGSRAARSTGNSLALMPWAGGPGPPSPARYFRRGAGFNSRARFPFRRRIPDMRFSGDGNDAAFAVGFEAYAALDSGSVAKRYRML